jgi:hypothetical protein
MPLPGSAEAVWSFITVKAFPYVAEKFLDYFVGIAIGGICVAIWLWWFPAAKETYLVQSGLGDHCPASLFDEAERSGVKLKFEPETTRNMAICGPGNYEGRQIEEGLKDYVLQRQQSCFVATQVGKTLTIKPNLQVAGSSGVGKAQQHTVKNQTVFTCRCEPEQIPLLLKRHLLCGLSLT